MTEIEVTRYVMGNLESYRKRFQDIESYADWWPIKTTYVSEDVIRIIPITPFTIHLKKVKPEIKNTIEFRYVKGPLRGMGRWIFYKINDENYLKVSYYIKIRGLTPLLNILAKTSLFKRIHQKQIKNIIKEAERLICKKENDNYQESS